MIWKVITNLDVDRESLAALLEQYEASVILVSTVNRIVPHNGLPCIGDDECCFFCEGPENLPTLLQNESLVNAVLKESKFSAHTYLS